MEDQQLQGIARRLVECETAKREYQQAIRDLYTEARASKHDVRALRAFVAEHFIDKAAAEKAARERADRLAALRRLLGDTFKVIMRGAQ